MVLLLRKLGSFLYKVHTEKNDPSVAHLPLVNSPLPVFTITTLYLLIVFKWGPAFMQHRKPYNIKNLLLLYNFLQIALNLGLNIYATYNIMYYKPYNLSCLVGLPQDSPVKYIEVNISYGFFFIKVVDYIETIFFVLRKSFKQVSFLHIYHHIFMVIGCYIYIKLYGTGGLGTSLFFLNTIVHSFMYTYYFVSALRPNMKNAIWWKKYITRLQLAQFVLLALQYGYTLLLVPQCTIPKYFLIWGICQAIFMILLFSNFYQKAYEKPKRVESVRAQEAYVKEN